MTSDERKLTRRGIFKNIPIFFCRFWWNSPKYSGQLASPTLGIQLVFCRTGATLNNSQSTCLSWMCRCCRRGVRQALMCCGLYLMGCWPCGTSPRSRQAPCSGADQFSKVHSLLVSDEVTWKTSWALVMGWAARSLARSWTANWDRNTFSGFAKGA